MHKIYIVGNPNSGKTTLFNSITKSSEHIGNWHGVTVDKKSKLITFSSYASKCANEENNHTSQVDVSNNIKDVQSPKSKKFGLKHKKNQNTNLPISTSVYEIIDLPGIYSLNAFSLEEQVSIDEICSNDCTQILYLLDANNFKRGMLLVLNLLMLNKNIKILINNYKYFQKRGGKIDTNYLQKVLGCEVEIIDAQKIKVDDKFFKFTTRKTAFITTLQNEIRNSENDKDFQVDSEENLKDYNINQENLKNCTTNQGVLKLCENNQQLNKKLKIYKNNIKNNLNCENNEQNLNNFNKLDKNQYKFKNIEILYKYISKIANNCVKKEENAIYGYSKFDKTLLKIGIYLPIFILIIFFVLFITFFVVGPIISDIFLNILYFLIQKPIMAILHLATNSRFIIALFEEGIFGACFSVLGFLPQISLMYLFLSILENSGLISRMAFLFDDFLTKIGLNGKMVYTLLMGFGCSTTASLTAKNMNNKNSQIKASLLTPFISCSAKLPIYTTLAGALLGLNSIWLIFGLYLLGIVMAIVLAIIFEHTILPSKASSLVLEFPPLKKPSLYNVWFSMKSSCKQFIVKVFGVIFGASVVLWLLSNVNIRFQYVGDISSSILYSFSSIISWFFKPIGLNNPNIICALLVGLVAKELILSSFAISNKITNLSLLGASLVLTSSAVNFNLASGVSFLVFTLLYFPCISNFGVLVKEVGTKYTLFGVGLQLALAYLMSFVVYSLLTKGLVYVLITLTVIAIVLLSIKIIYKKIKSKKIFCNCANCDKCK